MHSVLIKTTIPPTANDWGVHRFALLADLLRAQTGEHGEPLFDVVARDRIEDERGDDVDLGRLDAVDQLWLFAVDVVGALTPRDVSAIDAFRARGGGCLLTRDHFDMGSCLTRLRDVGEAHHFHGVNPEAELDRRTRDDVGTLQIDWPNYHSGRNGDAQRVEASAPLHPVMRRADGSAIEFLPAHPHEGAVSVPAGAAGHARVLATGNSLTTGRRFNIAVAFERSASGSGRALAEATFHRFADYNWEPRRGAPDFVTEPVGDVMATNARAADDARRYAVNIARWLGDTA